MPGVQGCRLGWRDMRGAALGSWMTKSRKTRHRMRNCRANAVWNLRGTE